MFSKFAYDKASIANGHVTKCMSLSLHGFHQIFIDVRMTISCTLNSYWNRRYSYKETFGYCLFSELFLSVTILRTQMNVRISQSYRYISFLPKCALI